MSTIAIYLSGHGPSEALLVTAQLLNSEDGDSFGPSGSSRGDQKYRITPAFLLTSSALMHLTRDYDRPL